MPTNGQFVVGELVTAADANTLFTRGYRNRIINGNFEINQRGYVSGTNLASGSYGFDRWKSGFTNTSLTFTDGIQATTVTISASGVLQQVIERENVPAGTYILSWTGTATGRIYNAGATPPAYAASPIVVTLDGLANVNVDFTASGGTRTLGLVQLEAGNVFSPFDYRLRSEELALCQRYYVRFPGDASAYMPVGTAGMMTNNGATAQRITLVLPVPMRRPIVTADLSYAAFSLVLFDGDGIVFATTSTVWGSSNTVVSCDFTGNNPLTPLDTVVLLTQPGTLTGLAINAEL